MGNNRKLKRLASLNKIVQLHRRKIELELQNAVPDELLIDHWRKEIANWEKQIAQTERQLTKHRRKRK